MLDALAYLKAARAAGAPAALEQSRSGLGAHVWIFFTGPTSAATARQMGTAFIREAIGRNLVASAQDVSGGGLAVALAECCIWGGLGAKLRLGVSGSPAIELFGESPSRLVLSCRPRHAAAIELLARQFGLHSEVLGTVGGQRLRIELTGQGATGAAEERGSRVADALDVSLVDLRHVWDHGLARALGVEHGPGSESPKAAPAGEAPAGEAPAGEVA